MHDYARLINAVAKADATMPPEWDTDKALKFVEQVVIRANNDPLLFADICDNALYGIHVPSIRCIIRLGILNGLRRPEDADEERVNEIYHNLVSEIECLPDDARKRRCDNFIWYQGRVWLSRSGRYKEAAENEEEEIRYAARPAEQAISAFLAHLYQLWHLLSTSSTHEAISKQVEELKEYLPQLQAAVKGTDLEVQWGVADGPIHLLEAMFLADQMDDGLLAANLQLLHDRRDSNQIPPVFHAWIDIFDAVSQVRHNSTDTAVALLNTMLHRESRSYVAAVVRLALARIYRDCGLHAYKEYIKIVPAPNCHMIAAVAAKELAAL